MNALLPTHTENQLVEGTEVLLRVRLGRGALRDTSSLPVSVGESRFRSQNLANPSDACSPTTAVTQPHVVRRQETFATALTVT